MQLKEGRNAGICCEEMTDHITSGSGIPAAHICMCMCGFLEEYILLFPVL